MQNLAKNGKLSLFDVENATVGILQIKSKFYSNWFQEFRDIFPEELTEMLIDNICLLVTSQSREVVNPSISFLHVFIQVQPVMESAKFCEKIVNSLCKMTEDCKRHFRLKTRYVLQVYFFILNKIEHTVQSKLPE